jgi:hypothetical protein
MTERIEALVAEILNQREVVLNRGLQDGVTIGMRFAILNSKGANIVDPETGEALGSVEVDKAMVKVVRVNQRLSVARTFRTVGGTQSVLEMAMGLRAGSPARPENLKTGDRTYVEELDESESFVKKGDTAVQIVADEFVE